MGPAAIYWQQLSIVMMVSVLGVLALDATVQDSPPAATDAPYVKAVQSALAIASGPDAKLMDANTPLNANTAAFLDRNAGIFDLVHAGNLAKTSDGGVGDGMGIQKTMLQLNGLRDLAQLQVLRARQRWDKGDFAGAQDDFLDAVVAQRGMAGDRPTLIASLVKIGADQLIYVHWAGLLPTAPAEQLAALPERLSAMKPTATMGDILRGEQRFAATQTRIDITVVNGMAPFYDAAADWCDQNPTGSTDDFKKALDDAVAKVTNVTSHQMAQLAAPSIFRSYQTICADRETAEMFKARVDILRGGESAAAKTADPFTSGPFEYSKTGKGFELRGKMLLNAKQVKLDFGK